MKSIIAAAAFCEFPPSWQNGLESIGRAGDDLIRLGAFVSSELAGYCVSDPVSGDLTQIAVAPAYRRQGIASLLFQETVRLNRAGFVKALNVEIPCRSLTAFLEDKQLESSNKQFEMIVSL